jgi:xylulokinase
MITYESPSCVVGCDIGTQSTKGVLLSESGKVLAVATARYGVDIPAPGRAEQDANAWIAAVTAVVSELARAAPGPVTHLGISAQVDGVVAMDKNLEPLHPAIIWMDRRAVMETASAEDRVGSDEIFAITGLNCDAGHSAPKMRWLLDRIESAPAYLMPPATVVTSWLCGNVAQDHANASSSMLYNVVSRRWSTRMLEAFAIDDSLLPPVTDATSDIGSVRPDIAEQLGLPPLCRVIAGTGDDHSGAVGAGAVDPGIVVDVMGTAEPIGTTARTPVFDTARLVETHAHAVPGLVFVENPGFVSGGSVLWLAAILGIGQAEVIGRAADATAGAKGCVFLPALSGAMTPRWNAHARGSFTGLTMEHSPEDLMRAVLEGCAFAAKDVIVRLGEIGLPIADVRVTGGGGGSPTWMQIKADVLGMPVRTVAGDASAMGAACLAATAAGWYSDVPAAARALAQPSSRWYVPHESTVELYDDGYRRYRQVFDALEPTYAPS